jgi:hypothetical protein
MENLGEGESHLMDKAKSDRANDGRNATASAL